MGFVSSLRKDKRLYNIFYTLQYEKRRGDYIYNFYRNSCYWRGFFLVLKINSVCYSVQGVKELDDESKQGILNLVICKSNPRICYHHNNRPILLQVSGKYEIFKGFNYGLGFVIQNIENLTGLNYEVKFDDSTCNLSKEEAENFIISGKKDEVIFDEDGMYFGLIKFDIPKKVESCMVSYNIISNAEQKPYVSASFYINIEGKKLIHNFCR